MPNRPVLHRFVGVPVLGTFLSFNVAHAAECGMTQVATHRGKSSNTTIYGASEGVASLYYRANMDVNTDGAARSYHPDDPRGERLAFNNVGNAITRMFDAGGRETTCSPRRGACFTRYIETFEAARDANYNPTGHERIETKDIIPWRQEANSAWPRPCTIANGPNAGYFVSQTKLAANPGKDACDQERYLDSLRFNATVLPGGAKWKSQGTVTDQGDLVVVRERSSGEIRFAVNGDVGPVDSIGEGSIALAASLGGVQLRGDETYREIRALARADVDYLTFPRDDIRRLVGSGNPFTQQDIDREGRAVFERWGGVERLNACAALPQ